MPRHNTITNSQKALFQKLFVAESDSLDEVLMSILSEINCCSPQLRYTTILSKTRPSKNYKYDEYKLCNKLKHMHQQVSICKSIYLNSDNSRGIYFRIRSYCFDFFTQRHRRNSCPRAHCDNLEKHAIKINTKDFQVLQKLIHHTEIFKKFKFVKRIFFQKFTCAVLSRASKVFGDVSDCSLSVTMRSISNTVPYTDSRYQFRAFKRPLKTLIVTNVMNFVHTSSIIVMNTLLCTRYHLSENFIFLIPGFQMTNCFRSINLIAIRLLNLCKVIKVHIRGIQRDKKFLTFEAVGDTANDSFRARSES